MTSIMTEVVGIIIEVSYKNLTFSGKSGAICGEILSRNYLESSFVDGFENFIWCTADSLVLMLSFESIDIISNEIIKRLLRMRSYFGTV